MGLRPVRIALYLPEMGPKIAPDLCPIMLFSGKGGVGKTTLAAATAVRLAKMGSRVLLVSSDPAHSLSDVFDQQLSAYPQNVIPGLDAFEVDAKSMFSAAMKNTTESFSGFGKIAKLVSETPGIDEFGAIEVLMQAIESKAHDVVIMDTAPTGHTLRLLMLPELLDGWFGTLLEMRGKLVRVGQILRRLIPGTKTTSNEEFTRELEGGRDQINRLRQMLTDPNRAQIILVTIPEAMSVLETSRTLVLLAKSGLPVGTIVVNQLQPHNPSCLYCKKRREIHLKALELMKQIAKNVPVRVVESLAWEIRGHKLLQEMGELVWGNSTGE
ncbi:MAG: ArsA family ATPase [Pseudomonadota bacterium]